MCPLAATERTEKKLMEQGRFLCFLNMTTGGAPATDKQGKVWPGKPPGGPPTPPLHMFCRLLQRLWTQIPLKKREIHRRVNIDELLSIPEHRAASRQQQADVYPSGRVKDS